MTLVRPAPARAPAGRQGPGRSGGRPGARTSPAARSGPGTRTGGRPPLLSGDTVLLALVLAATVCVALAAAAALGLLPTTTSLPTARPAAAAVPAAGLPVPVRLTVPALGVDVPLVRLGLDPAGAVVPPSLVTQAGWVEVSARPGRPGPAVLAGHRDSRKGPGVFARLDELRPGDRVRVGLDDGSEAVYVVRGAERHAKDAFPTDAVYGASPVPVLRLVTCGGEVDPATGRYRDNVVVYADLAA